VANTFNTNIFIKAGAVRFAKELETVTEGKVKLKVHNPGDLVPA